MDLPFAQRRPRPCGRRFVTTIILGALAAGGAPAGSAAAACGRPAGAVEPVAIDERFDITLEDGRIVRLGGLDPSAARAAPDRAHEGDAFLSRFLIGKPAELRVIANAPDRWGRVVADLAPGDPPSESAAEALLAAGFARVRPEFEARACAATRLELENEARRARRGVWADAGFAVLPASDHERLRQHDGQFVLVEGKVRRIGFGRSRLYLDLGARGGTTLVVGRKLEPAFANAGIPVRALQGETVRARGALDLRFGPRIEIAEPAMLEIVRETAPN
jgi:endonuclease YncB( thermonuclease family)